MPFSSESRSGLLQPAEFILSLTARLKGAGPQTIWTVDANGIRRLRRPAPALSDFLLGAAGRAEYPQTGSKAGKPTTAWLAGPSAGLQVTGPGPHPARDDFRAVSSSLRS